MRIFEKLFIGLLRRSSKIVIEYRFAVVLAVTEWKVSLEPNTEAWKINTSILDRTLYYEDNRPIHLYLIKLFWTHQCNCIIVIGTIIERATRFS